MVGNNASNSGSPWRHIKSESGGKNLSATLRSRIVVTSRVNNAHAAAPETFHNAIMGHSLTDHLWAGSSL